jgi:CheY-like chemotaxis protein
MTQSNAAGKPHILMVDDIADVVELTRMFLEGCGYPVSTAGSGDEALTVLQSAPVEIAVIDLGLPDMDGSELAMRIKHSDAWAHIKTIAVTGDAGADAVHDPAASGFDQHVIKPFSGADLVAVIEQLTDTE